MRELPAEELRLVGRRLHGAAAAAAAALEAPAADRLAARVPLRPACEPGIRGNRRERRPL